MVNKIGYSIVEQLTKNRFFITHPLLEILKKYISEHTLNIKINTIYYRARIIDEKLLKDHFLKNALICLCYTSKIKNPCKLCFTGIFILQFFPAERQGFEPRVPRSTTVFKTAAIDHSATSPKLLFQEVLFS